MNEQQEALRRLLEAFQVLNIPYLICGSLASSFHGLTRTTRDIDFVADLRFDQVEGLAAALRGEFYADPTHMRESLRRGQAFNVIHLGSGFKFDIFPLTDDAFEQSRFVRRKTEASSIPGPAPMRLSLPTAEDTLLAKLHWFRLGGEQSDLQWNDILGIYKVKRADLDRPYLRQWAAHLRVGDLLEELLKEG